MLLTLEPFPSLALTHGTVPLYWLCLNNWLLQRTLSICCMEKRITLLCTVLWHNSKMAEVMILYINSSTLKCVSYLLFSFWFLST